MKILKTLTLRGPNYWSIHHTKLIVMRLDLGTLDEVYSNEIQGFYDGLVGSLPSLVEHRCSPGHRGGFLERLQKGTLMGHIVEHVALELQELAGMPAGFGRTRQTSDRGVYNVVYEYHDEQAGRYAGRAAVRLCRSIVETGSYPESELRQDLDDLKDLWATAALGPSTETIVKQAEARGIPWSHLSARAMIQLGYGVNSKRIQATLSDYSSILGVELACDKEGTKRILQDAGIPVPRGTVINYLEDLEDAIADVGGYPIVIKPLDGNHGRGISINVTSWEEAETAYDLASAAAKTRSVIVERFYQGNDHRILVVDGKFVAVAERVPAHVVGDDRNTIAELIDITNRDPRRGEGHDNVQTKIKLDDMARKILDKQNYTLDSVPRRGERVYLRATANLSTGGSAIDRTDEIHPENVWLAERVARTIGLDIAGIDVVTADIRQPLRETDSVIVEVNAAPGFRMHAAPSEGKSRDVGGAVLDMLFPPNTPSRIPIVAITGTNGKTTTTRLTAHIFRQTQQVVGFTTTDGIYIGEYLVEKGDTTGPQSAQVILRDPTVEVAVLETARGGILRSGLAFDQCDVGVVLNVAADHLGLGDINTVEQMAAVKSIVAEVSSPEGYAVLNADDPLVVKMAEKVRGKVAYFSMYANNPIITDHVKQGGIAAIYQSGYVAICADHKTHHLEEAKHIPVTLGGMAPFMIANALAAMLAAFTQGVTLEQICQGLRTFKPSAEQTPGRMNLFDLGRHHALIDYAHNPAGYEALGGFVQNWQGQRVGVIGAPGDRRDEDLELLGRLSAEMFDYILVKEDDDKRGRNHGEVAEHIVEGIKAAKPDADYKVVLDEPDAIATALELVKDGGLVVITPESVGPAIDLIQSHQTSAS